MTRLNQFGWPTPAPTRLSGPGPDNRLIVGPECGVITTATPLGATRWDQLVTDLDIPGLVRHSLRHTALTLTWNEETPGLTRPDEVLCNSRADRIKLATLDPHAHLVLRALRTRSLSHTRNCPPSFGTDSGSQPGPPPTMPAI